MELFEYTKLPLTGLYNGCTLALFDERNMSVSRIYPSEPINSQVDLKNLVDARHRQLEYKKTVKLNQLKKGVFAPILGSKDRPCLSRLTLNIANSCNLWCSYCYADHGQYHKEESLMDSDAAIGIINNSLKFYDEIRTVHFFGGEPLLNEPVIHDVCSFFKNNEHLKTPRFVATTNGTVLSKRVEKTLVENEISLTISLDGPKAIHDQLRPTKTGASSFDKIRVNVDRLNELGIQVDFECTYTLAHLKSGISVVDLLEFFWNEYGVKNAHIAWAFLPEPSDHIGGVKVVDASGGIYRDDLEYQKNQYLPVDIAADLFGKAAEKSMENIASGSGAALTFVTGVLAHLASQSRALGYCPAFNSQLSISTDGRAFPCFMFIGDESMSMGNILEGEFPNSNASEIWKKYNDVFGENVTGSDAWYAPLISGCVAGDYIASGVLSERVYQPVQQAIIREVVLGVAQYINDN